MKKFLLSIAAALCATVAFAESIVVESAKMTANPWDSQFWVVADAEFAEGDVISLKMDVKADKAASMSPQIHKAPGDYLHWEGTGKVDFSTDWKTFEGSYTVAAAAVGGYSLAFSLNELEDANKYYFDNVVLTVNGKNALKEFAYKYDNGEIQTIEAPAAEEPGEEPGKEPAPGVNHVLKLTQADAKANPWDTQVFIKVSGLEANKKYVVTLDVMGGSEFTLGSESIDDVQQDHKDQWGNSAVFNYTDEIKVTTEWSVGTVNFPGVTTVDCDTHKEKHENTEYAATALLLNVGKTAGDLYIDNVVVKDEEGNVVYTQDFEEATCGADDVTKDAHFFGWQNATWAIVEAEGPTSLGALEAVNADAVAYDLFGNAGATKGFMVKGGKKVYVK